MNSAGIAEAELGLVARTRDLVPLLRENAQRTEEGRRVVEENIEALTHAGVFRMTVGRHFGGYESTLQTQYEVLAAIASGCPSTGWVATILTAMAWNAGMFSDEAQEEVFADPRVRIASVFAPGGQARAVDGGVVVNGCWPFNTGCLHSQWAILTALLPDATGALAPASLLLPYADQAQAPVTHLQVGEAMMKIHSADAHGRRAIELAADAPLGDFTLEDRALVRAHAAHAAMLARDAVDVLFRASGASSIQSSVPIQRYQRDIQALSNHAFLTDATSLELLGRVVCGLEPNTVFI